MINLYLAIFAVISYLIGSINWSIIISKSQKKDIRSMGSGNPGTLNMSRNFGLKFGLLTFLLDVLKGAVPTLVAFFVFKNYTFKNSSFLVSDLAIYLVGFSVVIGHIYPIFLKFKGGKGIASTIGALVVSLSVHGIGWASIAIMSLVAAILFIYFTEFGAMGSFIAITPSAIGGSIRLFLEYSHVRADNTIIFYAVTNILIFLVCFFTWFAHRKNIERMLAGEEHPTSIKGMVVKNKLDKLKKKENLQKNTEKNN
jgi:glycerol-3-phosphate acyltransferase PlsY